ncbi:hypothetical protein [Clostridium cylindrosporum]|uniref:Uncharacterized protein n=1 Tax=Clostridium cylindrosporum DSM 605 TaxID=1121307 RepID=A0A0J8DBE1_CLOCY|nr:hypothetical protein [Clostridium cylindrosporum]KMT21608.1 hypothetical protein CLCY_2c03700 [Clostridium cylindrosporum DSM 605]
MKSRKHILFFCASIILYIVINSLYIYHYYKVINLDSISTHLVIQFNTIGKYVLGLLKDLQSTIFKSDIFKNIMLFALIIYLVSCYDIIKKLFEIIKSIRKIGVNGIEICMEGLKENLEDQNEVVEKLKEVKEPNESEKEEIKLEEDKKKVKQLMLDCPSIVNIIDKFINLGYRSIKIPLSYVPSKYKVEDLEKIFQIEIKKSMIQLDKIKPEISAIVADTFRELESMGIIYRGS